MNSNTVKWITGKNRLNDRLVNFINYIYGCPISSVEHREMRNPFNVGECLGFIKGVETTLQVVGEAEGNLFQLCWPENGITNAQSVLVVKQYLEKHPEKLHQNETGLAIQAYMRAFSCKQK